MSRGKLFLLWLVSVLLALIVGALIARHYVKADCNAKQLQPVVNAVEQHNEEALRGSAVEANTVKADVRQEQHTKRILKEVQTHAKDNPMPVDCGFDAERMRQWRDANRGAGVSGAGEPGPLGAGNAARSGQQSTGRIAAEPRGNDGPIPPSAGTPPGAAAVAINQEDHRS